MKSDTPETEANTIHQIGTLKTAVVDVEFARKLERERDAALRELREKMAKSPNDNL